MGSTDDHEQAKGPLTLSFDIGGSHLKAGILSAAGNMISERVRIETPRPAKPEAVVAGLISLAKQVGEFDRVSAGFPGVVRRGTVLTGPNLGNKFWKNFDLEHALNSELGKPVRILNDASVQGLGVIEGRGTECVITMGTGMGFAHFLDGCLAPHIELSQHPIKNGKTYDEYVGEAALEKIGRKRWNKRVHKIIGVLATVVMYDTLYIGGGNSRLIELDLPANVKPVSNEAGITGGARAWDPRMDHLFGEPPAAFAIAAEHTR
jgi:polyphosphate glucokinase